jgi:hypothetical protein
MLENNLDVESVTALVLRHDEVVGAPEAGVALLAGNQRGVKLDSISEISPEGHDIEAEDVYLGARGPRHQA